MGIIRQAEHPASRHVAGASIVHRDLSRKSTLLLVALGAALWAAATDPGPAGPSNHGWSLTTDQIRVVEQRGHPDSFTIVGVGGDPDNPGRDYRMESWHYHANRLVVVFVDGDQRGMIELDWPEVEPGPTSSLLPENFALGMTVRQVEATVSGGQSTVRLDVPETSPDYVAVSYGALQLGFEGSALVYADTSPDRPDDDWPGGM
ncbi:MAG: hypothetical protein PVG92_04500 [Holophagae bacterium]|jgi:hypothetical protein